MTIESARASRDSSWSSLNSRKFSFSSSGRFSSDSGGGFAGFGDERLSTGGQAIDSHNNSGPGSGNYNNGYGPQTYYLRTDAGSAPTNKNSAMKPGVVAGRRGRVRENPASGARDQGQRQCGAIVRALALTVVPFEHHRTSSSPNTNAAVWVDGEKQLAVVSPSKPNCKCESESAGVEHAGSTKAGAEQAWSKKKPSMRVDKERFLGSFRKLSSLGCGLGNMVARRRLLVAPVSRSPSQELCQPFQQSSQITPASHGPTAASGAGTGDRQIDLQMADEFEFSRLSAASTGHEQVDWPWTDKYQPISLSNFISQAQTAFYLKQLVSQGHCPHLLFSGPPGSGKRSLILAMLQDLFGPEAARVRRVTKSFSVQGGRLPNFLVPVHTSPYHMEIDLCSVGDFAVDVLPMIIKEIDASCSRFQNTSSMDVDATDGFYKVLVVYRADRLSMDAQMVLRRYMDRFGDTCKIIFSCNSATGDENSHVLKELSSRCQYISIAPPTIDEIMKVLQHIAQEEKLDLPISLARRVAIQSKHNLKQAIISLEACKSHKYPFLDNQSIQLGYWEKDIVKIAADIISEPTPKQLFIVRPKLQALLVNSVPAALILKKLQEELCQNLDPTLGKEISDWAQHFDSKIIPGPEAMYQLEGFVAKFMSIYKQYMHSQQQQWMMNMLSPRSMEPNQLQWYE